MIPDTPLLFYLAFLFIGIIFAEQKCVLAQKYSAKMRIKRDLYLNKLIRSKAPLKGNERLSVKNSLIDENRLIIYDCYPPF